MTRARIQPACPTTTAKNTGASHGSNAPAHMDYSARIVHVAPSTLHNGSVALIKNADAMTEAATRLIACSGACVPILAQPDGTILAGEEFVSAYCDLGYDAVPVIFVDQLSKAQARAFKLSLRRIAQMAVFDEVVLSSELKTILRTPDLIRMTPYSLAEIDQHITSAALLAAIPDSADTLVAASKVVVSREGDLWNFHNGSYLLHGNSRKPEDVAKLFGETRADFVCTDPPYGIAIADISGSHDEFVQGSNVSDEEIQQLFRDFLNAMLPYLRDGCIVDTFIDHRKLFTLMQALREAGLVQKSLCTWDKQAAGMGAPYRNVAEHIVVSKFGNAPHIDNIQLGKHGRNRSTIWRVPGYAGFGRDRAEALGRHATSKPVALIADALLDFSHIGQIVYDPFIGSGTTLIAAARTQRHCYGIELDGHFVDMAVRRMEAHMGEPARLAGSQMTFSEVEEQRAKPEIASRARKRPSAPVGEARPCPKLRSLNDCESPSSTKGAE